MAVANRDLFVASKEDLHIEPLARGVRVGLLALVISAHVGAVWALAEIVPPRIVVDEASPMEVRMVAAEPVPEPKIDIPLPEDTPPPRQELESMIQPPPPDLPPPTFPVHTPPPPRSKPKPQVAKPPPRPHPPQVAAPTPHPAQPAAPAQPTQPLAPKTVGASQVSFLVRPNPVYPAHARRYDEQGVAVVRVLIDVAGRPAQVVLQTSSGHHDLDESALSAVRAAQFRPYSEGGVAQPVWVLVPIRFVLQ